jgi:hypothetical protein
MSENSISLNLPHPNIRTSNILTPHIQNSPDKFETFNSNT